jgi:hypothetical protein
MQIPLRIKFKDMVPSPAIEARIRETAAHDRHPAAAADGRGG